MAKPKHMVWMFGSAMTIVTQELTVMAVSIDTLLGRIYMSVGILEMIKIRLTFYKIRFVTGAPAEITSCYTNHDFEKLGVREGGRVERAGDYDGCLI